MRKSAVLRRVVIIATAVACLMTLAHLQPNNIVFASTPVSLKLPWRSGESWRYNQGPHGRGNGNPCENLPRSALDFQPPARSARAVLAAASGRVADVDYDTCSGNYVILEHLPGFYTFYGHLESSGVSEGSFVLQGQTIATAGNSGSPSCVSKTGYVLHFELLSSGLTTNSKVD